MYFADLQGSGWCGQCWPISPKVSSVEFLVLAMYCVQCFQDLGGSKAYQNDHCISWAIAFS